MFYKENYTINAQPTLPYICRIMESGAVNHANIMNLGYEQMVGRGISWVLAKMQIELFDYPKQGDTIALHTWPVEISRLQFRRDFELYLSSGDMFARALTQWVIVNLTTRKVERVPQFVADCHPHGAKYCMNESAWKIDPQTDSPTLSTFTVQQTDIDANRHVNNVRYVDWVVNSLPEDLRRPNLVEILFRSEAVTDDTISAKGKIGEDGKFCVSLFKDNMELVRARCCRQT